MAPKKKCTSNKEQSLGENQKHLNTTREEPTQIIRPNQKARLKGCSKKKNFNPYVNEVFVRYMTQGENTLTTFTSSRRWILPYITL